MATKVLWGKTEAPRRLSNTAQPASHGTAHEKGQQEAPQTQEPSLSSDIEYVVKTFSKTSL